MTIRPLTEIGNYPTSTSKAPRVSAKRLEELQGFEFLEEVDRLGEEQIKALTAGRFSFILNELEAQIKNRHSALPAIRVACKVIAVSTSHCFKEKARVCAAMAAEVDIPRALCLKPFVDHLYLQGDNLFLKFASMPFVTTYAKLYNALTTKDSEAVRDILKEPVDYSLAQHDLYILFDLACLYMPHDIILEFQSKQPFTTSRAYTNIILNRHLSKEEKLALFKLLHKAGVPVDNIDKDGKTPFAAVIEHSEHKIFHFLFPLVNLRRRNGGESYARLAIKSGFTGVQRLLISLCGANEELYRFAMTRKQYAAATHIAKMIRYKWENIPDYKVKVKPVDPEHVRLAKEAVDEADEYYAFYVLAQANPEVLSMETLTAIRDENENHYDFFAKMAAHAWGILFEVTHPENATDIQGSGFYSFAALSSWLAYLNKIKDVPGVPQLIEELRQVFNFKQTPADMLDAEWLLNHNDNVICLTGFKKHTTFTVFKAPYIFIANRGSGCINPGLSVYKAPVEELFPTIQKVIQGKILPEDDYPSEVDLTESLDLDSVYSVDLLKQSGGFCTVTSLKTLIFALLLIKSIGHKTLGDPQAWRQAVLNKTPVYKMLTTEYRIEVLRGVMNEAEVCLENPRCPHAHFYYQILIAILIKLESSTRFDDGEKKEYGDKIKAYLNRLVEHL